MSEFFMFSVALQNTFKLQSKRVESNILKVFFADVYSGPYQTCEIDFFCENSLLAVDCFRKETPSYMF